MKVCTICGEPIPELRKGHNVKYCSGRCARKAEKMRRIKYISMRAERHNAVAMQIYKAYGYKCAICQWQATPGTISCMGKIQYAHGNEIHHITPVREGGDDNWQNVILLCPNHHKQADMEVLSREDLREYTKPYEMTEEEKMEARANVADAIATMIFDNNDGGEQD